MEKSGARETENGKEKGTNKVRDHSYNDCSNYRLSYFRILEFNQNICKSC